MQLYFYIVIFVFFAVYSRPF